MDGGDAHGTLKLVRRLFNIVLLWVFYLLFVEGVRGYGGEGCLALFETMSKNTTASYHIITNTFIIC
jgi:hypothetical protein